MSTFTLAPLTPDRRFFEEQPEQILVGLSPWNGRYKPRYIESLVSWGYSNFKKIDIFAPGYEAAHTLTAAGIAPAEAVHRARRAINQLRNPALRALRDAGVPHPERHVHTWTQLHARPAYTGSLCRVQQAYAVDPAVRRACRATARAAVLSVSGAPPSEEQIDLAVGYTLAELPLVIDGPAIFDVSSSLFVYHREMELIEPIVTGASTALRPAIGQGYAIVSWEDTHDDHHRRPGSSAALPVPVG